MSPRSYADRCVTLLHVLNGPRFTRMTLFLNVFYVGDEIIYTQHQPCFSYDVCVVLSVTLSAIQSQSESVFLLLACLMFWSRYCC